MWSPPQLWSAASVIVLDASAAIDLLLNIEPRARMIRARLGDTGETLHAPHLIDAEVFSAVRHHVRRRVLSEERGRLALDDLRALRLARYPLHPLIERMWAIRETVSGFDAAYIALAEALDAPLFTTDRHLARTRGHTARIEALG
jgi:predicted nucleic acid-binding protein